MNHDWASPGDGETRKELRFRFPECLETQK